MKFFKSFLSFFCTITTAITIVVSLNYLTADAELSKYILFHILIAGFVTALITALVYSFNFRTSAQAVIATVLHYIALCAVMIWLGAWFDWLEFNAMGVLSMSFSVAIVYAIVFAISYIQMKTEADDMNKALEERNKEK